MHTKLFLILCFVLLFGNLPIWSQPNSFVNGKVIDEKRIPLAGVLINGHSIRPTVSGEQGAFSLKEEISDTALITIRYLGYQTLELTFQALRNLNFIVQMNPVAFELQGVELMGNWAAENTPFTYSTITRKELTALNMGQDLPWLMRFTTGVVSSSDAGTGIGYTGVRIRGSDPTRINVTLNGVPINDSESQAVFWVNMPDLASTVEQIQIQRGVGTSTNGAGAFGATVNLQTQRVRNEPYAEIAANAGSFNTLRSMISIGTGRIGNYWTIDGRYSSIASDGYIDRAKADLQSWYGALTFQKNKSLVKLSIINGTENTYQAWYGTPQSRIENDEAGMVAYAIRNGLTESQTHNLLTSGRTYNNYEYENEVDQYTQTHYHLTYAQELSSKWRTNATLHYTRGFGYFEQFREDDRISNYGFDPIQIGNETITRWDVVRRRWLDNHFGGILAQIRYEGDFFEFHAGGGWNRYLGDHYGRIIWSSQAQNIRPNEPYYFGDGQKTDGNIFVKGTWAIRPNIHAFGELQFRQVDYRTMGMDNNLLSYDVDVSFNFFNPKAGLNWQINNAWHAYSSIGIGNREPVRRDFVDAPVGTTPRPEKMVNLESGLLYQKEGKTFSANYYLMNYVDQLVPTGALNDVGASLLTNVSRSRRMGLEFSARWPITSRITAMGSLALNKTSISNFQEILYDYTDGFEVISIDHRNVAIAFSPDVVYNHQIKWEPFSGYSISWMMQYVSRQYLDNTQNINRALDAWHIHDALIQWQLPRQKWGDLVFHLQINNLLDNLYSNNGYTYSYIAGSTITENFYYPQAGRHFMGGVRFSF
jgi:iron complex outermembrane recepter protein